MRILREDIVMIETRNIFEDTDSDFKEESFKILSESEFVRIERIVSVGHTTTPGEWYDQECDEWIYLVSGSATLRFESKIEEVMLKPGDYLMIPAGCRHRVEKTDRKQKTIWLAVHVGERNKD